MDSHAEIDIEGMCHLCGCTDRPMHGRSHVIPAWIFRQISSLRGDLLLSVDVNTITAKHASIDGYEPPAVDPNLGTPFDESWYCIDCEKIFGKHDDFSAKFMKDPKNLGKRKALQRHLPPTVQRPETVVVRHMRAWEWRRFILSMIYRMHVSNHEQYRSLAIGMESAAIIRDLLIRDKYDKRLYEFDIVAFSVVREEANGDHAFVSPAYIATGGGGFTACFSFWGLWILAGYPTGSVPFAARIPSDTCHTVHFPLISQETSFMWFAQTLGIDVNFIRPSGDFKS